MKYMSPSLPKPKATSEVSEQDIDPVDRLLAYTGAALASLVILTIVIFGIVALIIINMRG